MSASSTARVCVLIGLVSLVGACRGPALWRYEEALDRTPHPAAHAVHQSRLQALMRDVDRMRVERLPQALEPGREEAERAREIAEVARAMADSAERIPDAPPPGLDAADQAELRALAESLRDASLALADASSRLSDAERRERLAAIDATCDRCHARFRIPGTLDERR